MEAQILTKPIGLEHPSVKAVLEIAEEVMNQNKVLNLDSLYNIAKKRLKIPRNGLLFIIQFLISEKILIDGSKFSKETVLSNINRKKILDYIEINPGLHFSILRRFALSNTGSSGQLIWHLEMLIKFNYIKKFKVGNYTVYIPFNMHEEVGRIIFLLRDRINYKLMRLLVKEETLIKSEIYKVLKEKRVDVYYRINNLMEYNLISLSEPSDKEICINLNKKELIIEILNHQKSLSRIDK